MNPECAANPLPIINFFDHSPIVRVYLSRAELTKLPQETVLRHERAQTELFGKIAQLPGVATVAGKPYEMVVQRAELHPWEEIHQHILDLLFLINLQPAQPTSMKQ